MNSNLMNVSLSDKTALVTGASSGIGAAVASALAANGAMVWVNHPDEATAESAEEEKEQHIASLAFHSKLSDFGKNKLLGFIIGFMSQILTELTLYKKLYEPPNFELWSKGREHQLQLIDALDRGDTTKAREIMTSHMQIAETLMKQQEAQIVRRFIAE